MKLHQTKIAFLVFALLCAASFAFFAVAENNSSSDKNIFLDSDQDGLSDDEEKTYGTDPNNRDTDGDGYADGVEVKSGYDPLRPAPGDKIINSPQQPATNNLQQDGNEENLTQNLSEEVASLMNEKMGENKEISIDDLNSIAQKLVNEKVAFSDLPEVDAKEIKIKKQDYSKLSDEAKKAKEKEDALEYLTAVSYICVNNAPYKISEAKDLENFAQNVAAEVETFSDAANNAKYFSDLAEKGEVVLEQLKAVEVPENMLDYHITGIKLARYAISLKEEAKPIANDPIASIVSLSKVQNLISLTLDFSEKISGKFAEMGITDIPTEL